MLRGTGDRHHSVEPARGFFERKPGAALASPVGEWGETVRAKTDDYGQKMYYKPEDFTVAQRVQKIAARRGVTASQVALAWMLSKPYVTAPIIGASKMKHLEDDVAALEIKLSDEEIKSVEEPYVGHPILGHS